MINAQLLGRCVFLGHMQLRQIALLCTSEGDYRESKL
jgi:hypothetical protein